ncbi:MAG TPA: ABC transporter permease [Polyangiales bacterium]|nr:ABC transporter permease [Polyangiales bacterium]
MASFEQSIDLPVQRPKLPSAFLSTVGRFFSRTGAILAFIALWETAPRLGLVERAFLPPFTEVLRTAWLLLKNGQLESHILASLTRSLTGFSVAILYAVPLGLAIGWFKRFADVLNPLLETFRNTAPLALLPVFLLLLGIGESSKIALVIYSCSWPILLNTISGVRNVDPLLIKSAKTMGLSSYELLRKVVLPASVPTIFVGIRLAGAYSLLVLVAAEMVGAKAGLGYLIIYSQYNFQIPHMYVGILTTTVIGLTFTQLLMWVERRFTSWKAPVGTE